MTSPSDPPRLRDPRSGAPDAVRSAMEAGRARLPSADALARLSTRLPLGGGPGPGTAAPPGAGAAPAAPSMLSGALIGAALALALVGAEWLREARSEAPAIVVTASARAVPAPPPVREAAHAPDPPERAPIAPERPVSPASPRPSAEPPPPAASVAAAPEPPAIPSAGAGATASAPSVDAETEAHLLQRAQDALAAPAAALRLTDEHLARFPAGHLAQEREVLAVTALLALGRGSEARARAGRFLAQHPASVYRARMEVLIPDLAAPVGAAPGAAPVPTLGR